MKWSIYFAALILVVPALLFLPACELKHNPSGPSDPTVTATFTPASGIVTGSFTPTYTPTGNTPTLTFTWTPGTPTSTFTPTYSKTPTPSSTVSDPPCAVLGAYHLDGVTNLALNSIPIDSYLVSLSNLVGGDCGLTLSQIEVYVSNSGSSYSSLELAVYDDSNRTQVASLSVPGGYTGWLTVSITPFITTCGHVLALAAHAEGPGLSIGSNSAISSDCYFDSGIEAGPMPTTYPHPTVLTQINPGACLEMGFSSPAGTCPSVTPTSTFTPTPTSTTGSVCSPNSVTVPAYTGNPMGYGLRVVHVLRSQSDWVSYMGGSGVAAPVDFASQMIVVANWGTEYCSYTDGTPTGRLVVYQINSACVLSDRVNVTLQNSSECGKPCTSPNCAFTMGTNFDTAVVLPASTLPVSVIGGGSVSIVGN